MGSPLRRGIIPKFRRVFPGKIPPSRRFPSGNGFKVIEDMIGTGDLPGGVSDMVFVDTLHVRRVGP